MDRETFDQSIRAFKNRSPFRPFTVVTVSGDRNEIDHADAIVIREGVAIFVGPGGVPHIFDHEGVSQIIGDLANQSRNGS